MENKLGYRIWDLVIRHPLICPANAHGAIIWRTQPLSGMRIDSVCRRDCAANGACWCGKLRTGPDGVIRVTERPGQEEEVS